MSSIWYTVTSKTVSSNSMLNNIELRVKRDSMLPYFFDDPVFDVNCFSPVFKFPSPVKSVNCFKLADDVIKLVDHVIDLR